jgi:hypothetical protein
MEQELTEVLWWCVFDYHPDRGATFNTFFQTSARNRISSLQRSARTIKRSAELISLDDDEVRASIEAVFDDESAETTVVRRIMVREVVEVEGIYGLRQLIRNHGMGVLLSDDEEATAV